MKEHKEILERRGDSMTDTSPLINLKDALSRIKEEIKEFDLQISLLVSFLLHLMYSLRSSPYRQRLCFIG